LYKSGSIVLTFHSCNIECVIQIGKNVAVRTVPVLTYGDGRNTKTAGRKLGNAEELQKRQFANATRGIYVPAYFSS
jgi:hypothetical protein